DVIISQDPQPGSKVSKGGTVEVVVSKGAELVTVPDCRGLSRERAEALIESANLKVGDVTEEFSATAPQGKVSSQSPEPGAKESVGATVDLAISKGPESFVVPNVVGMTKDAATKKLQEAGFKVEAQDVASTQPEGNVTEQNPAAGQKAAKGSVVVISVSKKSELVTVPNVIGASQNTAETTLTNAGLVASVVQKQTTDPSEVGFVLDQDPPAGTTAQKGSTVTIYVGVSSATP
ncbi:MAG: PASTA domain-containing protein, partial [Actinobacteria bacterium]|nr:PASTA domain-containing protein [Actinomycetota bacterium]